MQLAKRYFISGMVQGVGFRYFAQCAAQHHHVEGFVRNLQDGRVEVFAQGREEDLNALFAELRCGARMSRVERVDAEDAAVNPRYAGSFTIERGD
jgi:acylphosphatase